MAASTATIQGVKQVIKQTAKTPTLCCPGPAEGFLWN